MKWNLDMLYKNDDDPQIDKDLEVLKNKYNAFAKKWKDRNDYLQDPAVLKEALDEYEGLQHLADPSFYFSLRHAQEQNNPKIKAKMGKIRDATIQLANAVQFFSMNIAKIKDQDKFLETDTLQPYHHYIRRQFKEAKYLLTDAEEKILNLKTSTSYSNWIRLLSGLLTSETREVAGKERSFQEIISLFDEDKPVRDEAADKFNEILHKWSDVAEQELNTILEDKKVDDVLRGIPRPDMDRHLSDDIDTDVVDALISAVDAHFDIAKNHYGLKSRLLGKDKLAYHERNVPVGSFNHKYPFEQAVVLVEKVMDMHPRFKKIFTSLLENKQYDVYPRKGKTSGAFCASNHVDQPTFILLNHTKKLQDVLTLAHETGHTINNELMKKQHALNFGTSLATAEVASTFMEDFVLQQILKKSTKEEELSLRIMKLDQDVSTIFRQAAAYKFELALHEHFRKKGYLSKQEIGALFQEHMKAYMGRYVEQSPGSENWWIYWGHLRYYFYNYSYVSGLLISKSMQAAVREDPAFVDKVVAFLSAGLSDSPKNIFAKMGIDITDKEFWNRGLESVHHFLKETEELAEKLGKI